MRSYAKGILTLGVVVALGMPVWAQGPRMVPEEGAIQLMLLRQKSVRDDLHLTPDEAAKIEAFGSQQWKKAVKIHESTTNHEERHAKYKVLADENEKFIHEVLEPAEIKRLDEITLQRAGFMWITRPDIAAKLELTPEQKEKAAELQKAAHKEMHDVIHTPGSWEDKHATLKELHAANEKKLMALLTDAQEAKWKEMCGAPFAGELRLHDPEGAK